MTWLNKNIYILIEKYIPWISICCFLFGIFLAKQFSNLSSSINNLMNTFIEGYGYIAPIMISLILIPTLLNLFTTEIHQGKKFSNYSIWWFVKARLMACILAVVATTFIFNLPLELTDSVSLVEQLKEFVYTFSNTLLYSSYFYAIYVSIFIVFISLKYKTLGIFMAKGTDIVEYIGKIMIPLIPIFMIGVGIYVTTLPQILESEIIPQLQNSNFGMATILWVDFDTSSSTGILSLYILAALLTGVVGGIWHIYLLFLTKKYVPSFSIKQYLKEYWIKIYPLLWGTSSEALSMPLNLYLVKNLCPEMHSEVRQFVIGTGSIININGTIINVFIMTGVVTEILGLEVSFVQMLFTIPIVFLVGYGVSGVPGELLLFAGPVAACIAVSSELLPVFLSLYIGLQIGLPDSFRTGANSTDDCLSAIILDVKYKQMKGSL